MAWQQINLTAFLLFFLELAPFDGLSNALVQINHCLTSTLPEISRVECMIIPMRIWLLKALFKCFQYLFWILGVFHLVIKYIVTVKCFITPTTRISEYYFSVAMLLATKIIFIFLLKIMHASTLTAAHHFISRYFSQGTDRLGIAKPERCSLKEKKNSQKADNFITNWQIGIMFSTHWDVT